MTDQLPMNQRPTAEVIYLAIARLIETQRVEQPKLAAMLHQRMYEVAWTTGTELLEELRSVLRNAVSNSALSDETRIQVEQTLELIDKTLG